MDFRILYEDENFIGIYKPAGLPVHRGPFNKTGPFLLQELRNQCGRRIYPVHRLDQAASGVMLFAFSSDAASAFAELLRQRLVTKKYLIMVRGYLTESGVIDSGLSDQKGQLKDSVTMFRSVAAVELDMPTDRYPTSRYSLADVKIETGRRHQIRRHFSRISHPVIGDSVYGDLRHNRIVSNLSGSRRLMLFSWRIFFDCPVTGRVIDIRSLPDSDVMAFFYAIGWGERVESLVSEPA